MRFVLARQYYEAVGFALDVHFLDGRAGYDCPPKPLCEITPVLFVPVACPRFMYQPL